MRAVVVVESYAGNTRQVGDAVAERLRAEGWSAEVLDVVTAPAQIDADLLVVGAPTHNLGMSTPGSRARAAELRPTGTPDEPDVGAREWLSGLEYSGKAAVFATKVHSMFAGSACKGLSRALTRRGATVIGDADFLVAGAPPVLEAGELDHVKDWVRTLQ